MITLMHGDCLEKMQDIPDGSVDMVLADPPYGTTACKWDSIIPLEPMWEHLKRVIKPNGAIVLTASQPFTTTLIASNMKMFKYCWVWDKMAPVGFVNAKLKPMNRHEDIVVFSVGKTSNGNKNNMQYNPQGLKKYGKEVRSGNKKGMSNTYWRPSLKSSNEGGHIQEFTNYPQTIISIKKDGKGKVHPTQKPVALMEYLIKTYTNEGETVLDFTMGSGTTGVACANLNRKFIGIELDDKYFEIAKERIEKAQQQTNLFI